MDKDTTKSTFNEVLNQFPFEKFRSQSMYPWPEGGTMRGYIRPRGQDSWEVTVSTGKDLKTGKYGKVSKTVRGTMRDAEAALAELGYSNIGFTLEVYGHATKAMRQETVRIMDAILTDRGDAERFSADFRQIVPGDL